MMTFEIKDRVLSKTCIVRCSGERLLTISKYPNKSQLAVTRSLRMKAHDDNKANIMEMVKDAFNFKPGLYTYDHHVGWDEIK